MVKIVFESVTKVFKRGSNIVEAVKDANLKINSGEFFGILGPSGSGKTTTLRLIAGLEEPTKGKIYFNEELVAADGQVIVPVEKRNVGLVFQTWALYPHMTCFDNIAFPLRVKKLAQSDLDERVNKIAKTLGIDEILYKYPREISGGQQQRVSLARALVKDPSLLLLDEPFSNLDALMRDTARALVREVQQKLGVTTIIVSHDPADMFALVEKAAVIVGGNFKQIGAINDIYERPADSKVASLLGEVNLFEGEISAGRFSSSGLSLQLDTKASGKVILGLRPEDVRVGSTEPDLVHLGKFTVLVGSYQGGAFRITTKKDSSLLVFISDVPYKAGETLDLYAKKGHMKVFDQAGELVGAA